MPEHLNLPSKLAGLEGFSMREYNSLQLKGEPLPCRNGLPQMKWSVLNLMMEGAIMSRNS